MHKYIFHIDLNAFYATAEQIKNPELEGIPLAVGGSRRRGVVTTASYEARAKGVKSGMPASEAIALCPDIVFVKGDMAYYKEKSQEFVDYLKIYTDQIEKVSIDECYLDLTDVVAKYDKPLDLAVEIQQGLYEKTRLTCSIGISVNKFVAKMASDMRKPMGITLIRPEEIEYMIHTLPIEDTHGIGKKTAPLLKKQGIHKIGDLLKEDKFDVIRQILGKNTINIINRIQGIGNDLINIQDEVKSIGNSRTFNDNVTDYTEIRQLFLDLSTRVAKRMEKEGVTADTITITIRTSDFETITRSKKLDYNLKDADDIFEEALLLYDQNEMDMSIRLLGVTCNNLKPLEDSLIQMKLDL